MLIVVLAISGCGGGSAEKTPEIRVEKTSEIRVESPAVASDGVISPRVRCGAGTLWLPLKWGTLPSGTKELVLYFGWFKEGPEAGGKGITVPFGVVLRKIKPSTHGVVANTFPEGSEYSYSTIDNCQRVREGQSYLIELFALNHSQHSVPEAVNTAFVTGITEEALRVGRFAGDPEAETPLTKESLATGHFVATYGPKPN
jgi:hypothetical protein